MDLIYSYMSHRHFPKDLRRRVARYFKKYFETKTAISEDIIMCELDPDLRHEVGLFLCHSAVAHNYIFEGTPRGTLLKLGISARDLAREGAAVNGALVVEDA